MTAPLPAGTGAASAPTLIPLGGEGRARPDGIEVLRLRGDRAGRRGFLAQLPELLADPDLGRSHFFEGRYENLYPPRSRLAPLVPVLDRITGHVARRLGRPAAALRLGCWLNLAYPGQRTLPHTHDDDDELVSGVYYLRAPASGGDLVVHLPRGPWRLTPVAGRVLLFPPHCLHEVEVHRGAGPRVSLAFNIGAPD